MQISDFQFLLGVMEFSAALNFGFAISEDFRNRPKRKFDEEADNFLRLQQKDKLSNSNSVDSLPETESEKYVKQSRADGVIKEDSAVLRCNVAGTVLVAFLLSLAMLPYFQENLNQHPNQLFWLYTAVLCVSTITLIHIGGTYWSLLQFWQSELKNLQRTAKVATEKFVTVNK